MKKQWFKLKHHLLNPKQYWVFSLVFVLLSSVVYIFTTEVKLNQKNYNEVLPKDLKNYKIVNQDLDRQFKNFRTELVGPKSSWLYQIELELPDSEYFSIVSSLKERNLVIDYERSLVNTFLYRPHSFLWSCFGIFAVIGLIIHMYQNF